MEAPVPLPPEDSSQGGVIGFRGYGSQLLLTLHAWLHLTDPRSFIMIENAEDFEVYFSRVYRSRTPTYELTQSKDVKMTYELSFTNASGDVATYFRKAIALYRSHRATGLLPYVPLYILNTTDGPTRYPKSSTLTIGDWEVLATHPYRQDNAVPNGGYDSPDRVERLRSVFTRFMKTCKRSRQCAASVFIVYANPHSLCRVLSPVQLSSSLKSCWL
jgi:hypothetical protein